MKIALAQANAIVGDIRANADKAIDLIKAAKRQFADLIIFPELFLSGYPPEDLLFFESFIDDCEQELFRIAKAAPQGIISVIGAPTRSASAHHRAKAHPQKIFNSAAIVLNGEVAATQHKKALPNYGVFDERRYFLPGKTSCLLKAHYIDKEHKQVKPAADKNVNASSPDFNFGVTICEDIWVDNGPHKQLAAAGADIILNLSSSPYHSGKWTTRRELLEKRTKQLGIPVVYVNLVGGQDELVFDGRSMVMTGSGELFCRAAAFEEDLVIVDIPLPTISGSKKRTVKPSKNRPAGLDVIKLELQSRRPANKKAPAKNLSIIDVHKGMQAANHNSEQDDINECDLKALCLGLQDYFLKNNFQKAIIGLSGGIDSALTAVIAVRALGPENVTCLMMPSRYSSKGSISDSKKLAKNLGISSKTINIDGLFSDYNSLLKKDFHGRGEDITEQNLQARIRGNILMAYANKFGFLVLATGNKSELAVGYSTLYGDMVGGFAVIKDLFKTKVYALSRFINDSAGFDLIPQVIIDKAPSAELKPDQKDEDDLPEYSVLDQILSLYVEEGMHFDEICARSFEPNLVKRILDLVDNAEYKRRQGPLGVKISPRAFGKDRRMPITNGFKP